MSNYRHSNNIEKIAFGTVQFGIDYGINNNVGIPSDDEIEKMISFAIEKNIDTIDTAHSYGNSEERLGNLPQELKHRFKFISKAPSGTNKGNFEMYFDESLDRVHIDSFYGYLLHSFKDYLNDKTIFNLFEKKRYEDKTNKIGFSVYYPQELDIIFNDGIDFDLIQIPYNLADRRFEPYFEELKKRNVEIHARSVFLQGLFFMSKEQLSNKLKPFAVLIDLLNEICNELQKNIKNIALNFVLQNENINKSVIGIDSFDQVEQNVTEAQNIMEVDEFKYIFQELSEINLPEELLIPSNWN